MILSSLSPLRSVRPSSFVSVPVVSPWSTPLPMGTTLYESPVQSPRQWHRDRVAEQASQVEPQRIPVKIDSCCICGIGIGPGHVETELYLYPVRDQWICDEDDNFVHIEDEWLVCCGGCARHKRRNLPDVLCLIDYHAWNAPLASADAYVRQSVLLLILFALHLPLSCMASPSDIAVSLLPVVSTDTPSIGATATHRRRFGRGMSLHRTEPDLTPSLVPVA